MDELKTDQSVPVPQVEFDGLRRMFGSIGVTIALDGELPDDSETGLLFTDIIREGVSNAVKHGFATEVSVTIRMSEGMYRLMITDNGRSVKETFTEGGGFGGIRRKLEPYGGVLTVTYDPRFTLGVTIPGGGVVV